MGIRIKRAVGWGITPEDFEKHCLLNREDDDDDKSETLWSVTSKIKEFEIPKEARDELESIGTLSVCHDLLKGVGFGHQLINPYHQLTSMNDLYDCVLNYDNTLLYMFYPCAGWVRDYVRRDAGLDYVFSGINTDGSLAKDGECRLGFATQLKANPYPYTNDIHDIGNKIPSGLGAVGLRRNDRLAPTPPVGLQYWLRELKILDEEGIWKLRPYAAEWWG
jgi:hypothetical protein